MSTRKSFRRAAFLLGLFLLSFLAASGCDAYRSYYISGTPEERRMLKRLLSMMEEETGDVRATIIMEISDHFIGRGHLDRQILFLTQYVQKHPGDPYNSFYLALVAEAYEKLGADPLAMHYYERILKNHPDMMAMGSSIHYVALTKLLESAETDEVKAGYYKELISRFGDLIDVGATYYYLARTYERLGEWDLSIQAYKKFLAQPDTTIPGHPNIHQEIAEKVAFYNSNKSWTVPDLQALVTAIQVALRTNNAALLKRYKAPINFFSKYWGQKDFDPANLEYFNIYNWLLKSNVRFAADLESDSSAREAYLKTWNWLYHVDTWYFYFRRIDFPANPDIDGRWEWAGVYFGEKG